MKATLRLRRRVQFDPNCFAELVIWELPEPVPPSMHRIKYRLVLIADGRRVVGFDNERGKGDHCHLGDTEVPYPFTSVETLIADFLDAVETWRRDHG